VLRYHVAVPGRPAPLRSALAAACLLLACSGEERGVEGTSDAGPPGGAAGWPEYGGDAGGRRFTPLADVTPANVERLRVAWTHHTGDLPASRGPHASTLASEVTPILVEGSLVLCTPYNRVIALDAETGAQRWAFDPGLDLSGRYGNQLVCRGVAAWRDPERVPGAPCRWRIFTATNDARLFALDGATGSPCGDFGAGGAVDLNPGAGPQRWRGEYQVTSPPAVGRDVVIVGSAVSDNQRVDAPSGVVRGFDARSGAPRWAFDLAPPGFERTPASTSAEGYALGTPNVWGPTSIDRERDLLFVPTGNPAPDYFRGDDCRDHYGSSVVALRASTGEVVWSFQTVHHDLWDYDVGAQPTLFDLARDGRRVPAVVVATKMGLLFVLDRETGEPLFPVEERPVPQGPAPGERLAPTQPFPLAPPPLVRHALRPDEAFGLTPWDRGACRERIASLRNEGIYTPPALEGTLVVPGNAGGVNWGGVAVDEERQRLVVNVQDLAWAVWLLPRDAAAPALGARAELAPMDGTPYRLRRELVLSPLGVPCSPPPWGELVAVDLASGALAWRSPLGTLRDVAPVPLPPVTLGVPNLGGPLLTASGLVFIGAAFDRYFRAFDAATGEELWRSRLPAGPQATPMSYRAREGGRQYVVVAATGYGRGGMPPGDAIVAFALGP
jgi:quinoprotein glucose dehydrogenase